MLATDVESPVDLLARLRRDGVTLWNEGGALRYRAPRGALESSDLQALKKQKQDILALLKRESDAVEIIADPDSRFEPFPLTDVQSAYLLGRRDVFDYGGIACHVYMELHYPVLDPVKAEAAWNRLVSRHDMLRVTVDKSGYQQVLAHVPPMKLSFTDTCGGGDAKEDAQLKRIREEMGHRIYETETWPLFDVAVTKRRDGAILHFSMDFLMADWASIWILLREFEALSDDPTRSLPELGLSFRDYQLAERRLKESAAYVRDKAYWLERIDQLPPAPDLPRVREANVSDSVRFRRRSLHMNSAAWEGVRRCAQTQGVTPTSVVLAAYAAVLERWSHSETFCLNLTVLNRLPLHPEVNDIVGDFTTVNLLAVHWRPETSFYEHARALQRQLLEDLDHRLFSGVEVLREVARRHGKEAAFMPVVFTSAIGLVEPSDSNPLKGKIQGHGISQTPQVFIDCQAMDSADGLRVNWDIREGVFPEQMADDMFDVFEQLLHSLSKDGHERLLDGNVALPVWQVDERRRVNGTEATVPTRQLHLSVLEQAVATPDSPAVIYEKGYMTYGALAEKAYAVADELRALGCRAQERVGIVMEKCAHQVAAVLGTLCAGAVYVPIDTVQPSLRCAAMLEEAGIRYVLTSSTTRFDFPETVETIAVDTLDSPRQEIPVVQGDSGLPAYIIYTSGSTGQPKGVVVSHRAALNTIEDINRRFSVTGGDKVLGLAQLGFDLSVYDIFGPLAVGGALVYPSADRLTDPSHWAHLISEHGVTIWNSVPALMSMLVTYLGSGANIVLQELRLALLSGDWIPLNLPDRMAECLPSAQVVSLGGATEAAIWSICHTYKGLRTGWNSIPYGRPLANQGFRVLDSQMRDCPVWVTGELYITGHGLAEGYWKDAEKTNTRFFNHPTDGQRLYRTGDLGRYTPGGDIEFFGREDNQVKIKGHRIELEEIESTLLKHPAVASAGVVVHGTGAEQALLGVVETAHDNGWDAQRDASLFHHMVQDIGELAVGALAGQLNKEAIDAAADVLDRATLESMLLSLCQMGLFVDERELPMEDILQCGVAPQFHWLVRRWIAKLVGNGLLEEPRAGWYRRVREPDRVKVSEAWQDAEATWDKTFGSKGFIAYVQSNAVKLTELLKGTQDPVSLLFPEGKLDCVESIYSDHAMADYLNNCICILLKRIAEKHADGVLRILEVGAGTGATTERVLKSLEGFDVDYLFTDVAAFFTSGAKSRFGHMPGLRFGMFDMDEGYRSQGLSPNSFDIVLAAGVLENAKDIPQTLDRLTELISPGGWLVFTEPTEEHAWILASQGFMMTEPGDSTRTDSSYLLHDQWLRLLDAYGTSPVLTLPEEGHKLSAFGIHLYAKQMKSDRLPLAASEVSTFLAGHLPAYMVPSHLQVVDALPLTGNGKIDRAELVNWRPESTMAPLSMDIDDEYADEQEAAIAQIWASTLGLRAIGRMQNFYDYGADSLIMAQVAGVLRDKLAEESPTLDIPFDTLLRQMLNYPTVAELSAFISSHRRQAAPEAADALSETFQHGTSNAVLTPYGGGDEGPLRVVFHAGLGTMNCFRLLLSHLAPQNLGPVVGITVADTDTYCAVDPVDLIEHIADDYAERLVETGHGQMQLIGYCSGGLIAVEVARRLLEMGIEVEDLVLIDSHPVLVDIADDLLMEALFVPNLNISLGMAGFGDVKPEEVIRGFKQIMERHGTNMPAGASGSIGGDAELDKVGALFRTLADLSMRERFNAYVAAVSRVSQDPMPVEMAEGLFLTFCQSFRSARFSPLPYMGDIRFLLAKESTSFLPNMNASTLAFWQDICLGEFTVDDIGGNHLSCIEAEPHAGHLAKVIAASLI